MRRWASTAAASLALSPPPGSLSTASTVNPCARLSACRTDSARSFATDSSTWR